MLCFAALAIPAAVPQDDPRGIAFQNQIGVLRARLLTVGGQAGRYVLAQDIALAEAELYGVDGEEQEEVLEEAGVLEEDEDHDNEEEHDGSQYEYNIRGGMDHHSDSGDSEVSFDTRDDFIRRSPRGASP